MKKYIIIAVILLIGASNQSFAQKDRTQSIIKSALKGLEYQVKGGLSIGGMSPLPLPAEIRKIDSYSPELNLMLGGEVTKWFTDQHKWGITLGITLEDKAMRTKATVKNYGMTIIGDGGEKVSGRWTGGVQTKARNSLLSFPILATMKLTDRWRIKAGPFFSYVMTRNFSGYVYEGYLRENDPTGPKFEFTGDSKATYDFSKDLKRFQWGLVFGGEWKAFKHLNVFADLNWGMNDIFKKDFDTITFKMYAIYMNVGFGYAF